MFSSKHLNKSDRLYIYAVHDKYTHAFLSFHVDITDGMAARYFLKSLQYPIRDTELVCIGSFVKQEITIKDDVCIPTSFHNKSFVSEFRVCSWESYKFPENVAEALAPLNLSQSEISEISQNKIKDFVEKED